MPRISRAKCPYYDPKGYGGSAALPRGAKSCPRYTPKSKKNKRCKKYPCVISSACGGLWPSRKSVRKKRAKRKNRTPGSFLIPKKYSDAFIKYFQKEKARIEAKSALHKKITAALKWAQKADLSIGDIAAGASWAFARFFEEWGREWSELPPQAYIKARGVPYTGKRSQKLASGGFLKPSKKGRRVGER